MAVGRLGVAAVVAVFLVLAVAPELALAGSHGLVALPLRSIPVRPCNGELQGQPYKFHGPSTVRVRLSARDAARLVAFNAVMLAPRGWHCDFSGGSGGGTLTAYNPKAGFFPADGGGYRPQEAVSAYYATTGTHALAQACPYFSEAAAELKRLRFDCGSYVDATPMGESQTHRNLNEIDFADPPHRSGTGSPSGGRNRALGLELFDSAYERSKGGYIDNAATATCTLAPKDRHLCAPILAFVRVQFAQTLKQTR